MTISYSNITGSHHHSQIYPIGDSAKKTTQVMTYPSWQLPKANCQQSMNQSFFTAPSYLMTNMAAPQYLPTVQPFMLPMQAPQPAVSASVPLVEEIDMPEVDSFDEAAYHTVESYVDEKSHQSSFVLTEAFDDVKGLSLYARLAIRLAKSHESVFQMVVLPNGHTTHREAKHAKDYKLLCRTPMLSDVEVWLPRKILHPLTELMLSSLENQPWREYLPMEYLPDRRTAAEHCNAWLTSFRHQANQPEMQKKIKRRDLQAKKLYFGAVEYVESLFKYGCARKLVLRLDLGVRAEYQDTLHVFKMRDALQQLLKNAEHNSLFEHMEGSLCRLEYTKDKSYHYHLLLFFDGSKVQQDEVLVDRIGAYWAKKITKGQGTYWNCHRNVSKYKRCGIGMINWNDTQKLQCLLEDVLPYLTYADKDIRLRITEDAKALGYEGDVRVRTFRRGAVLKEKTTNRGRPRRDSFDFNDEASVADELGTNRD